LLIPFGLLAQEAKSKVTKSNARILYLFLIKAGVFRCSKDIKKVFEKYN